MKKRRWGIVGIGVLFWAAAGCGGEAGTEVTNPPSTKAASAIAAIFSNSSSSGALVIRNQNGDDGEEGADEECPDDPGCTCEEAFEGGLSEDNQILNGASGDPGQYGSTDLPITLDEDDFCALSDGSESPTQGPDGRGRLATFELTQDITLTCTDTEQNETTVAMESGSTGVWRETDPTETEPAFHPQAYGAFIISVGEEQATVDCTVFLLEGEEIHTANCTDDQGQTVDQESDLTCEFDE